MSAPAEGSRRVLVIGWGNTLRGDDGAGIAFAEAIAAKAISGVDVLAEPQLAPDLAEDLSAADLVVFADACVTGTNGFVKIQPGDSLPASTPATSHYATPGGLLDLCATLYGRVPEAWVIGFDARDFECGIPMSGEVARAVESAVEGFAAFLDARL